MQMPSQEWLHTSKTSYGCTTKGPTTEAPVCIRYFWDMFVLVDETGSDRRNLVKKSMGTAFVGSLLKYEDF